jgi:hypothetical protein
MKTATWTIAPERLRAGYKAYRLLDKDGDGLARLPVDPHNPRRPHRLSMWPVGKVCLSADGLTPDQTKAVLAHVFPDFDPSILTIPEF